MKQVEHISLQEAAAKFEPRSAKMGPMSLLGPLECTQNRNNSRKWYKKGKG